MCAFSRAKGKETTERTTASLFHPDSGQAMVVGSVEKHIRSIFLSLFYFSVSTSQQQIFQILSTAAILIPSPLSFISIMELKKKKSFSFSIWAFAQMFV